jgi:hypothetical protein
MLVSVSPWIPPRVIRTTDAEQKSADTATGAGRLSRGWGPEESIGRRGRRASRSSPAGRPGWMARRFRIPRLQRRSAAATPAPGSGVSSAGRPERATSSLSSRPLFRSKGAAVERRTVGKVLIDVQPPLSCGESTFKARVNIDSPQISASGGSEPCADGHVSPTPLFVGWSGRGPAQLHGQVESLPGPQWQRVERIEVMNVIDGDSEAAGD